MTSVRTHSSVILSEAKDLADASRGLRQRFDALRVALLARARSFAALRMTVSFPFQSTEIQENR